MYGESIYPYYWVAECAVRSIELTVSTFVWYEQWRSSYFYP